MLADNAFPVHLIESQHEFDALCADWSRLNSLSFDTEFIRTNTFYPKLGLLQLADTSCCYLIDPLCVSDWNGFSSLLSSSTLEFTVHSCSEDLNLLSTTIRSVPNNLFDTQLAAAFTGLGFSLSYQGLVKLLLDTEIAKDETRSDWLKRPLSDKQLVYAANDVCYLEMLREKLLERLEVMNRAAWFYEECSFQLALAGEFEERTSWEAAYTAVSNAWKLEDNKLIKLQQLCLWREEKARQRNKPRNWIAKDSDLYSLATEEALNEIEYLSFSDRKFYSRYGEEIIEMLDGLVFNSAEIDRTNLNYPLTPSLRKKLKSCQRVVAEVAEKISLAPELLARKRLLQDLLRNYESSGELLWEGELAGWRREILEDDISVLFSQ